MGPVELPPPVVGSLSPSRAADFKTCPLLYRFRVIDRLAQRPSRAATRGTLVHGVLERLFDLPAPARTPPAAHALLLPEWDALRAAYPEVDGLFADPAQLAGWLASARDLLDAYFALEDPARVRSSEREQLVEVLLPDGLLLRGIVDRLDVAPTGEIRVVDYKTGSSPRESAEARALFQMKFYALVLWRRRGVVPRVLRLMYLGDQDTLTYVPEAGELERFERTLRALWGAIEQATRDRDFRPNPSRVCTWCDHRALCPAWGGTPPAFPDTLPPPDDLPELPPYERRPPPSGAPGGGRRTAA